MTEGAYNLLGQFGLGEKGDVVTMLDGQVYVGCWVEMTYEDRLKWLWGLN